MSFENGFGGSVVRELSGSEECWRLGNSSRVALERCLKQSNQQRSGKINDEKGREQALGRGN